MAPKDPEALTMRAKVTLQVDGRRLQVPAGTSVLTACLANGIFIPNLCWIEGVEPPAASCRLCFVEVEGLDRPVTACTEPVREGLVVNTATAEVRRLQKAAFSLLLSVHDVNCKHCPANRNCALQDIARFLKLALKPKGLVRRLKEPAVDEEHPCFAYFPNRCVLCGRCIQICRRAGRTPELTFARRGFDTVIRYYGGGKAGASVCADCRACVEACPVGALVPKEAASGPPE
jgi:NADH dehydrogenase/NADH:ubiquinone oxidoreductase subunit G